MNPRQLRESISARPFQPFWIYMADGRRYFIASPDAARMDDTAVTLAEPSGVSRVLAVAMMTELVFPPQ